MNIASGIGFRTASLCLLVCGATLGAAMEPPLPEPWVQDSWCPSQTNHAGLGRCVNPSDGCVHGAACSGCANTSNYWRECVRQVKEKVCRRFGTSSTENGLTFDCGLAMHGTCEGMSCIAMTPGGSVVCGVRNCENQPVAIP